MRLSRHLGTITGGALLLALAALLLSGCASTGTTQTTVYSAANALTAADDVATKYVTLPLCGPTHPAPLCSDAAITAQIKSYAQKAHDAVKAAEAAGDSATLATANAAIAALVSVTPKPAS
jgi:hypothetical protein